GHHRYRDAEREAVDLPDRRLRRIAECHDALLREVLRRLVELERERHQSHEEERSGENSRYGEGRLRGTVEPAHIRPASMTRSRNWRVRSSRGAEKICWGGPSSRMTPPSRKQILSAHSRAKPISCVAMIIVMPSSARVRTRSSTSPMSCGSS